MTLSPLYGNELSEAIRRTWGSKNDSLLCKAFSEPGRIGIWSKHPKAAIWCNTSTKRAIERTVAPGRPRAVLTRMEGHTQNIFTMAADIYIPQASESERIWSKSQASKAAFLQDDARIENMNMWDSWILGPSIAYAPVSGPYSRKFLLIVRKQMFKSRPVHRAGLEPQSNSPLIFPCYPQNQFGKHLLAASISPLMNRSKTIV